MDKKTLSKLLTRYSLREIALFLGVSERTVQGWKYGRTPSRWLHTGIRQMLSQSNG